jgi:hypothetical protein
MTISKSNFYRDPIETSQASVEKSKSDFLSFSEEKFRKDVIYYKFLITSAKYLEIADLPKIFSEGH